MLDIYLARPILSNFAKFLVDLSNTNFYYSSSKQFFLGLSIFSRIIWDYVRHRPTKRCNHVAHKTDFFKITFVTYTWQFVPNLYSVSKNKIKWWFKWIFNTHLFYCTEMRWLFISSTAIWVTGSDTSSVDSRARTELTSSKCDWNRIWAI